MGFRSFYPSFFKYLELNSFRAKLTRTFNVPSRYGSARVSDVPQSARAATLRPVYLTISGMGAPGYRDPDRYWHPPRPLLGFASVPSARAAGITCT